MTGVASRRMSKIILVNANSVRKINYVKMPLVLKNTPEKLFEKPLTQQATADYARKKYVLTFQDSLTKFSKAIPIENQEASRLHSSKAFVIKIILENGIFEKILTDQGTNFTSEVFKNVCKLLKIEKIQTTAYHPESNGALDVHTELSRNIYYINTLCKRRTDELRRMVILLHVHAYNIILPHIPHRIYAVRTYMVIKQPYQSLYYNFQNRLTRTITTYKS